MKHLFIASAALALAAAGSAQAAPVSWTDVQLGAGNPTTSSGVTLTTTMTGGGSIGFITGGIYAGLYLGGNNGSGVYTLTFSEMITAIEIEFDAASATGGGAPETLTDFMADGSAVSVDFTNQVGMTFDGSSIVSTINDGMGIINFASAGFSSFSFSHTQGTQAGLVIERILVETGGTAPSDVPVPAAGLLLLGGLGALGAAGRRRG